MDVGAILSRSFELYKRNPNIILPHIIEYALDMLLVFVFVFFGAIVLLLTLGSLTLGSVMALMESPIPFLLITLAIFAILALFFIIMLLNAFAKAAVIGMVIEARKEGKTSLGTGIESAKRYGLPIIGYTLLITFVPIVFLGAAFFVGIMAAVFAVEMASGMGLVSIAFIIFFLLMFLLAYVIIYVLAIFTPQKIVVEKLGAIDGIKASFSFVRKYLTETVIYIGVAVALVTVTSIASMLFAVPGIVFENISQFISVFFTIIENIVSVALGLIVAPYLKAVKTLMVLEGGEKDESESAGVLQTPA